jgi:hypothetical protein
MDKNLLKKWFDEFLEDIRVIYVRYNIGSLYFLPATLVRLLYLLCVLVLVRENPLKELERGDMIALGTIFVGIIIFKDLWIFSYLIWWYAFKWLGMITEV